MINTRDRYFEMTISLGISGPKLNLWDLEIPSLIDILLKCKFPSQLLLEDTLYKLRIKDRGRTICLTYFYGQLERDGFGRPFWRILLETSIVTTGRSIAKAVSKKLFKTEIDPTIDVYAFKIRNSQSTYRKEKFIKGKIKEYKRNKIFWIEESEVSPGYFQKKRKN